MTITDPRPNLFLVSRTSNGDDIRPCPEAMKITIRAFESSPFSAEKIEEERLKSSKEEWFNNGSNHYERDGRLFRENGTVTRYAVELNSLDDLKAFVRRYNEEVIISYTDVPESFRDAFFWRLEIYDDYRE